MSARIKKIAIKDIKVLRWRVVQSKRKRARHRRFNVQDRTQKRRSR